MEPPTSPPPRAKKRGAADAGSSAPVPIPADGDDGDDGDDVRGRLLRRLAAVDGDRRELERRLRRAEEQRDEAREAHERLDRRLRLYRGRLRDAQGAARRDREAASSSAAFAEHLNDELQRQHDAYEELDEALRRCYAAPQPLYPDDCAVCGAEVPLGGGDEPRMLMCMGGRHAVCRECLERAQAASPPSAYLLRDGRVACPLRTEDCPCAFDAACLPPGLLAAMEQRHAWTRRVRRMQRDRRATRRRALALTCRHGDAAEVASALFSSPCPGCLGAGPFMFRDCLAVHACPECCDLEPRESYHCPFCALLSLGTLLAPPRPGEDARSADGAGDGPEARLAAFGEEARALAGLRHPCVPLVRTVGGDRAHAHALDCPARAALGARSGFFSTPVVVRCVNRQLRRMVLVAIGAARHLGVPDVFACNAAALFAAREAARPEQRAAFDGFVRAASAALTRQNADLGDLPPRDNFFGGDDDPEDAPLPDMRELVPPPAEPPAAVGSAGAGDGAGAPEGAVGEPRFFHSSLEGRVWRRDPAGHPRLLPGASELARGLHRGAGVPLPGSRAHALLQLYLEARHGAARRLFARAPSQI